jgi:hypothetical protein
MVVMKNVPSVVVLCGMAIRGEYRRMLRWTSVTRDRVAACGGL